MKQSYPTIIGALIIFASGCATSSKNADISQSIKTVSGIEWKLVEIDGKAVTSPLHAPPTLLINDNQVSGYGGCNRYGGGIKYEPRGRELFSGIFSTRKACAPDAMNLEASFLGLLEKVSSFSTVKGGVFLELNDGSEGGRLIFEKKSP